MKMQNRLLLLLCVSNFSIETTAFLASQPATKTSSVLEYSRDGVSEGVSTGVREGTGGTRGVEPGIGMSRPSSRPLVRWNDEGHARAPSEYTNPSYTDPYYEDGTMGRGSYRESKYRRVGPYDGSYRGYGSRGGYDSYQYGGGYERGYDRGYGRGYSGHTGPRVVQGNSLQTWSNYGGEMKEVTMRTDGRPLEAEFQVWDGPDNTPSSVRVYSEDGYARPFRTLVENPRGHGYGNAMSVRNVGSMEFPIGVGVSPIRRGSGGAPRKSGYSMGGASIQGGSLKTFTVDPYVRSVQVDIESDGLPIKAVVEIWQGPGHARQVAEIYQEDGLYRPFSAILDTPGYGCSIGVRNVGPIEFPIRARIQPR